MPRGANSRGVRKAKAEAAETNDVPAVETALDQAADTELVPTGWDSTATPAEVPLHARDFDWDTMRWAPPKSNGSRPCLCNRIAGHECDLTTKSRFAIGHDARFKGVLQTAFRTGTQLRWSFDTGDTLTDPDSGLGTKVEEPREELLGADQIARFAAPKLLPHVTHQSRGAKLQALDAEAGTTVPQTAVDAPPKADEELTDADLEMIEDDDTDQRVADEELAE